MFVCPEDARCVILTCASGRWSPAIIHIFLRPFNQGAKRRFRGHGYPAPCREFATDAAQAARLTLGKSRYGGLILCQREWPIAGFLRSW